MSVKNIFRFICVWVVISTAAFSFPYYVHPDIMEEVKVNEARLEKTPTDNEVLFDLAMSYAYSGQILNGWTTLKKIPKEYSNVVIPEYTKLMEENPTEWKYPFKLAFGYFFAGRKKEAIASFHDVLKIDSDQVWAIGFIALVYGEMNNVEKTKEYCLKGIKMEPNATGIHFLLGEAYRREGRYMDAFKQVMIVGRLQVK